jgi:hypothetical protein
MFIDRTDNILYDIGQTGDIILGVIIWFAHTNSTKRKRHLSIGVLYAIYTYIY